MIVSLKRTPAALLYGGVQSTLLILVLFVRDRTGCLVLLAMMATISFYAWIATFKRYRAISDTPTSEIASAAQGYIELLGHAQNHPDTKILAHLSQRVCCWFQYKVERRQDEDKWELVDEGQSAASFLLRDSTGVCLVDPEGAEILCARQTTWVEADQRLTEWWIDVGDPLYALGEFRTRSLALGEKEAREDVSVLLAKWKRDRSELLRRFDLDRSGEIDFKEWSLARAEAKRQVRSAQQEFNAAPSFDCLRKPEDGRLYLLSNYDPMRLMRRIVLWFWAHLALFFAAIIAFVYLLARSPAAIT